MSKRHAYQITVETTDHHLYTRLKEKLNTLFHGHVTETEYGLYAEDSPGVDSVFEDGPPYISQDTLQRELSTPAYEGVGWERFLEAQDQHNLEANTPEQTSPYTEVIQSVVLEYANDTSGTRKEEEIEL